MKQYKDFLFINVPQDATDFRIWGDQPDRLYADVPYDDGWVLDPPLPPGPYQIIGKGDLLAANQWAEIFDRKGISILATAAQELKSLGMEPGTTLILKKL